VTHLPFIITIHFIWRNNETTYLEIPYNLLENKFLQLLCPPLSTDNKCYWINPEAIKNIWTWFRHGGVKWQSKVVLSEQVRKDKNKRTDYLRIGSKKWA